MMTLDKKRFKSIGDVEMPKEQREFLVNKCGIRHAYRDGDVWYVKREGGGWQGTSYFRGHGTDPDGWKAIW